MLTNVRVASALTEQSLWAYAQQFGEVISIKVPTDAGGNAQLGYVCMGSREQAEDLIADCARRGVTAHICKLPATLLKLFRSFQDRRTTNVYFAHLPRHWTEDHLVSILPPLCIPESVRVIRSRDSTASSCPTNLDVTTTGVAFCRMQSRDQASCAIETLNGVWFEGCTSPIQARFADSPLQKQMRCQGWFSTAAHQVRATAHHPPPTPVYPFCYTPFISTDTYGTSTESDAASTIITFSEATEAGVLTQPGMEDEDQPGNDQPNSRKFERAFSIANMGASMQLKLEEYIKTPRASLP